MAQVSIKRASLWAAMAALFGLMMRVLAVFATNHPHVSNILLDVVNWAALWGVIPVLVGRGAQRAGTAGALGLMTAALEIVVFYGDVFSGASFKLVWLLGGAAAAGLLATLSQRFRRHAWSPFILPALFVIEPALGFFALQLLRRDPWSSWGASAVAEVCVGIGATVAVALLVVRKSEQLDAPAQLRK